jgi:hypothetical protein
MQGLPDYQEPDIYQLCAQVLLQADLHASFDQLELSSYVKVRSVAPLFFD